MRWGKRFEHLKAGLGFSPTHVFHSIRKTVVTILENTGVPENVVADIVGHEKPTMTYGLYSGGATLETKRKALAKLCYPTRPGLSLLPLQKTPSSSSAAGRSRRPQ